MSFYEVNDNLLGFLHVKEIVAFAPLNQLACLLPIVGFLTVSHEDPHCGVKCVDVVDAVGWYWS